MNRTILAMVVGVVAAGFAFTMRAQQAPDPKEGLARAGDLHPRVAPTDYASHAQVGDFTVAAEFMGNGLPTEEGGPYTSPDYVVVEAAVYGKPGAKLALTYQDFSLRINGKKQALPSTPYLQIFHSLKDPSWQPPEDPNAKASKTSIGGGGEDPADPPRIVHMPMELRHAMERNVTKDSFPEGERALPQAGLLYFEYHGALKSIRSIDLIYQGAAGKATIPLHP